MEPLKVVIHLKTPMVEPKGLFHLDSLLASLRVGEAEADADHPINPRDVHHDLPLERFVSPCGEWVFKASAFTLHRETQSALWMQTGRTNLHQVAQDRDSGWLSMRGNKPNTAGGPFKSTLYNEMITWAGLCAYCIGEKNRVESLVSHCKQVGGRRGVGFGQVASITVERVDESDCRWFDRAMPSDSSGSSETVVISSLKAMVREFGGLRPPYWDQSEHREILVPN